MNPRPATLKEVAERSESLKDFGWNLADWLHELRRASSRRQASQAAMEEPPRLKDQFPEGYIADAWLAAYAEHLAIKLGATPPEWAFASWRTPEGPLFDEGDSRAQRTYALIHSPYAFKRRNIFTGAVDLPLRLRAGRPTKSQEEKRKTNAERQRRFRQARRDELIALRAQVAANSAARSRA